MLGTAAWDVNRIGRLSKSHFTVQNGDRYADTMLRTDAHFTIQLDEVQPAPVRTEQGWRDVDIRFLITRELAGSGSVCLFRALFPPGAAHESHRHPHADEFFYVIRGRALLGAEAEEHAAGPGTVEFVPAGRAHWLRNPDPVEPVEVVGGYLGVGSLGEAGYELVGR
jgi:quercetin dioxygenase-like cupin family protein